MTSPNQSPPQPTPETMSPFDLAVYTANAVLSYDPRTKHRDSEGEPLTEGLTRSIEFGDCGIQELTDTDGNIVYHYTMIKGDFRGFFVDLNTQTGVATKGMKKNGVVLPGVAPVEDHDYVLLNVTFPEEFTRVRAQGEIVFPSWEVR